MYSESLCRPSLCVTDWMLTYRKCMQDATCLADLAGVLRFCNVCSDACGGVFFVRNCIQCGKMWSLFSDVASVHIVICLLGCCTVDMVGMTWIIFVCPASACSAFLAGSGIQQFCSVRARSPSQWRTRRILQQKCAGIHRS
jgi:hypothetical protein